MNVELSVVMVAGHCRQRAQRSIDAIAAQQLRESIELVVVDLAPGEPPLTLPGGVASQYVKQPAGTPWGAARAEGFKASRGRFVAFVEDHCYPLPGWAQAVVDAFGDTWGAVGYAFVNANPESYVSRAGFLADYGLWLHPAPAGERTLLPGNNVAYRRSVLERFDAQLGDILSPDYNLHETMRHAGYRLYLEGKAVVAHENFNDFVKFNWANYWYCRLLAFTRASSGKWSVGRRLFYGAAVPLGAPAIKSVRLLRAIARSPSHALPLLEAMPVLLVTYLWSAVGEALGYVFGAGDAWSEFNRYEIDLERSRPVK